jgi:ATP-dependent RNA helicase DOB1
LEITQQIQLKIFFQELSGPLRSMQDMARRIAQNSRDAKIEIEVEDYVAKFKPFMMDVVFEWCKGASFSDVCKMTDLFEGKFFLY